MSNPISNYLSRRRRAAILAAQDMRNTRHAGGGWWTRAMRHHQAFARWLRLLKSSDTARAARGIPGV